MKEIYTRAKLVIAWLGEPTDVDEEEFLVSLSPSYDGSNYPQNESMYRGRHTFLSNGYWSRMWIIQEYLLPDKLILMCGPHIVDPSELYFTKKRREHMDETTQAAGELLDIRHERETGPMDGNLSSTLFFFRRSKCKEPYDMVYALLGLAPEVSTGPYPIIPNYRKRPVEVMIDVIRNQYASRDEVTTWNPVSLAVLRTALQVSILELTEYFLRRSLRDCLDSNLYALVDGMRLLAPLRCIGTVVEVSTMSEDVLHANDRKHLDHFLGLWASRNDVDDEYGVHTPLSLVSPDMIRRHITNLIESTGASYNGPPIHSVDDEGPAEALSRSISNASDRCNLIQDTAVNCNAYKQLVGTGGVRGLVQHNTMINNGDQIVVHTVLPHAQYALVLRQAHKHEWVLVGHAFIWSDERVDTPIMDNTFTNGSGSNVFDIKVCCHDSNEGLQTLVLFSGLKIIDQEQMNMILARECKEPRGSRHNCKAEKVLCDRIWLDKPLGDMPLFGWG